MGRRGRPVSGAQKRTKLGSSVPSSLMSWQGRQSWWEGFDPVAVSSDPTTNWGPPGAQGSHLMCSSSEAHWNFLQ